MKIFHPFLKKDSIISWKHPNYLMATHSSKVNKKGMVTIPFKIRERFDIQEGTEVTFVVEEGSIILVPILKIDKLRKFLPTSEEMIKNLEEIRETELELERKD